MKSTIKKNGLLVTIFAFLLSCAPDRVNTFIKKL